MTIRFRGKLGIVIGILGVVLFFIGQQELAGYQTTAGQVERTLSSSAQQQYEEYLLMRTGGIVIGLTGAAMVLLDLANTPGYAKSDQGQFSDRDIFIVPPGEFQYVEFDTRKEAILDYSAKVLDGPPINIILTDRRNINNFKKSSYVPWVEAGSAINVESVEKTVKIGPRDYALIIDNTGRHEIQQAGGTARVDLQITATHR